MFHELTSMEQSNVNSNQPSSPVTTTDANPSQKQNKPKPRRPIKAYWKTDKNQIDELQKQQQQIMQQLEQLTFQNQYLKDRAEVLKDVVTCVDEVQALREHGSSSGPPQQVPQHQESPQLDQIKLWNEGVQSLTKVTLRFC
jgi:hypothetical protein